MEELGKIDVNQTLKCVLNDIDQAVARRSKDLPQVYPRLVVAAKTKPAELLIEAYEAGQRHFGENYAYEMNSKATNPDLLEKCPDIKWHFIGHLQSNKINKVLSTPGIYMIETVDSVKLADNLDKQWPKFVKDDQPLNVMVQVNTSGEEVKSGIDPNEALALVEHIRNNCKNLKWVGLMMIGEYRFDVSKGPNPDFARLVKCRDNICKTLQLELKDVELSMGMSTDYEQAVETGSTNVRVGAKVLGDRHSSLPSHPGDMTKL